MEVYEYQKKDSEEKSKAVDVMSLLQDMKELEEFNGVIESKIYENWYEIKRQLTEAAIMEISKEKK